MNNPTDFAHIRQAARGRWLEILAEIIGADYLTGKNQACPACGGVDRFQFNRHSEAGAFVCRSHPRQGGDGFELIRHALGCSFTDAMRLVGGALGLGALDVPSCAKTTKVAPVSTALVDWRPKRMAARSIWTAATPITASDPAGRYLIRRGLPIPPDADALRYHAGLQYWSADHTGKHLLLGEHPALIARIVRPDGLAVGLHRIFLDEAGEKFSRDDLPAKKLFKCGELVGAAVRLSPIIDDRLAVAEGIENALAFGAATGLPCWSALSASLLPGVALPPAARRVYVALDPDQAGQRAASRLAERMMNEGRQVFLCPPPAGAADWNDALADLTKQGSAS
ncbi:MAG: toprim domain-containing protein [Dechloromonas sp.]|nr:toprim domain-containing protein [Dechloromonas sp.]